MDTKELIEKAYAHFLAQVRLAAADMELSEKPGYPNDELCGESELLRGLFDSHEELEAHCIGTLIESVSREELEELVRIYGPRGSFRIVAILKSWDDSRR